MSASGLFARLVYAVLTFAAVGISGFAVGIPLFTAVLARFPYIFPNIEGYSTFLLSLSLGIGLGFTLSMYALTLPWSRLRKRRGRWFRIVVCALVVLFFAVLMESQGRPRAFIAVVCLWLSLTFTYTFIRYGLLDSPRRRSSRDRAF